MNVHQWGKRGQSLVELALMLPFLLWVVAGILDFGRVYYYQVGAINAARAAVRVAADAGASDTEICTAAQNDAAGSKIALTCSPDINNPASNVYMTVVQASPHAGGRWAGDEVSIRVTYTFKLFTPLVERFIGNTITVQRTATMKVVY